ncbi:transmembrane amino acid transporter protein [Onchocerca flexuosa]|uniref:Transmembrane amino acid transporter protein n=1 Tax=Onchocerca flexuosa TaxID=387005 RepID=A0A238BJC5_9BILA|nr:transmembrane amino acid transporter protein [Onchocerca flexuosa]
MDGTVSTGYVSEDEVPITTATSDDKKASNFQSQQIGTEDTSEKTGSRKIELTAGSSEQRKGINWFLASMFILGDLVGGGVVAMPVAFIQTGFILGTVFMLVICIIFVITGWLLADTWEIMRERWPEYREHCRKPFSEMARRSMSKESEWAVLIAVLCTIISIVMLIVGISLDFQDCYHEAYYPSISIDAILSLGIFLFAFNGHQVFPTVQNDMRNPTEFKKSVFVGFIFVALLYMPLSAYSFLVYGNSMADSVINSLQIIWIRYVADLSIAMHCILAIIITVNPINLQLEDTFDVPNKFCLKRVIVRTGLLFMALFVALSLPNFGAVMNLFGSTTVPCTCVVLPTLYSVYIKAATYDKDKDTWIKPTFLEVLRNTPKVLLLALIVINVITIICSLIATVMSVKEIIGVHFIPPCYILPFLAKKNRTRLEANVLNCCGKYMNISRFGSECSALSYALFLFS